MQIKFETPDGIDYRAYSIASSPDDKQAIELNVKLIPEGLGSSMHTLQPGDKVQFSGPYGEFYLRTDSTRKIICVAGGVGLAPIKAITSYWSTAIPNREIELYYGSRTLKDLYDHEILQEITEIRAEFHYYPALSEEDPQWKGERGFIHKIVEKYLEKGENTVVLIIYFVICTGLTLVIPQRRSIAFYHQYYPTSIAWIVTSTHFHDFFRSLLFLLPAAGFVVLVIFFTIPHFVERVRDKSLRIYGWDILQIGVLLLIVSGGISFSGRKDEIVFLQKGETVFLPGGHTLVLTAFDHTVSKDIRPKTWSSIVKIIKDRHMVTTSTLRVHEPLRIGELQICRDAFFQKPYACGTGQR